MVMRLRAKTNISYDRLKELLDYNPDTGLFTWLVHRGPSALKNSVAGSPSVGSINIMIDGRNYKAHRLAWLFMTGQWPTVGIDHIDCNPMNNKWDNLRPATQSQNNCNKRRRRDNSTGFKGVCLHQGRYRSRISLSGQVYDLGVHATPEQAHVAYRVASPQLHGEFGRVA